MTKHDNCVRIAARTALVSLALLAQLCRADDYFSPTDERVRLSLGAMYVFNATTLRADSSTGVEGTEVGGESLFGLSKGNVEPKFEAVVRADTRQRLFFDYFTLDRSGSSMFTGGPLFFRNVVFLPGDPLQTRLDLRMFGISYGYSFWHSETLEIAVTGGVHATDVSTEARVQTATRHIIQDQDASGPIPTLGIDATWVASKRFYFDARVQYISAHVGDFDGSLGLYEVDGLYRFRPNVSFGIGYTGVRAHLDSTRATEAGLFDFNSMGPDMFVRVGF
jgi:hypothetical protein